MKAKHRPSIDERLDSGMVHVNSIIPNNLRICPVADKHESQLSGKKKKKTSEKREKKGCCRWLLRRSTIKALAAKGSVTVVHLITRLCAIHHPPRPGKIYTSFVFSARVCRRARRFLRSSRVHRGISDRKNSTESRPTHSSSPVFTFLSLFFPSRSP